jgi:hypothetical protein
VLDLVVVLNDVVEQLKVKEVYLIIHLGLHVILRVEEQYLLQIVEKHLLICMVVIDELNEDLITLLVSDEHLVSILNSLLVLAGLY